MRKLRIVELMAWIVGVVLLAIWVGFKLHAYLGSRADIESFEQARGAVRSPTAPTTAVVATSEPQPTKPRPTLSVTTDVDYSLWAEGRIKEYEESLHTETEAPLAIFRTPELDLEVAVLEGTSDLVLNRGVGRIEGTAGIDEVGNLGIAGHRDGFFRGLKDIDRGDTMELETLSKIRTYVIDDISIVSPEDVYVLAPSAEPRITLVTCYPFYFVGKAPLRYIVHGREIRSGEESPETAAAGPS